MAKKTVGDTSKEFGETAKAPWFQFSIKRVTVYFILALVVYVLVMAYLLLVWPEMARSCPVGSGMACALGTVCGAVKGIVPVVAVAMLVVSITTFAASRLIKAGKRSLTEFSVAMLCGFVFGILLTVFSSQFFSSMGLC
ncbi:MAG: hypothetical protein ABIF01_03540 [Candidatus Micrarchaeota archaeon]